MILDNYLTKISDNFVVIFVFILVVSGNYIGELLPCKVQYMLQHNILYKHFFGILTMFFFVLLALPEYKNKGFFENSIIVLFFYSFFLLLAKTHYKFWIGIMFSLALLYIFSIYRKGLDDGVSKNKIILLEKIMSIGILTASFIGVIIYYFEKKMEYKKNFSIYKFVVGTVTCKNNKSKRLI